MLWELSRNFDVVLGGGAAAAVGGDAVVTTEGGWVLPQPDGGGHVRPRQGRGGQGGGAAGVGLREGVGLSLYLPVFTHLQSITGDHS